MHVRMRRSSSRTVIGGSNRPEWPAERLARKFEKDMLDFEHKERIELANHRRRLDDFAARYRAARTSSEPQGVPA